MSASGRLPRRAGGASLFFAARGQPGAAGGTSAPSSFRCAGGSMVRWFLAALLAAGAGVCVPRAAAQTDSFSAAPRSAIEAVRADTPFIGTIQVEGLRRVPEQTDRARERGWTRGRLRWTSGNWRDLDGLATSALKRIRRATVRLARG